MYTHIERGVKPTRITINESPLTKAMKEEARLLGQPIEEYVMEIIESKMQLRKGFEVILCLRNGEEKTEREYYSVKEVQDRVSELQRMIANKEKIGKQVLVNYKVRRFGKPFDI